MPLKVVQSFEAFGTHVLNNTGTNDPGKGGLKILSSEPLRRRCFPCPENIASGCAQIQPGSITRRARQPPQLPREDPCDEVFVWPTTKKVEPRLVSPNPAVFAVGEAGLTAGTLRGGCIARAAA